LQFLTDTFEFPIRGDFQRLLRVSVDRGGVHQILVQEQLEEVVTQIVVSGNVAAAAGARISTQRCPGAHQRTADAGHTPLHRIELIAIAHQDSDQRDQIVALPHAIHVGLGRPDAAVERGAPIELRIAERAPWHEASAPHCSPRCRIPARWLLPKL
jgi:hypothetical protein